MKNAILIGEAGGTSTQWRLADSGKIRQFVTKGYNPQTGELLELVSDLKSEMLNLDQVSHLFFYAAGLVNDHQKELTRESLAAHFIQAHIEVENDVMAAARGLCGKSAGWIGFLGTGSGLAYYDGESVTKQVPSLGFILGDEGSGAYMGKRLTRDYFRGKLTDQVRDLVAHEIGELGIELKQIYQRNAGSAHLARLTKVLHANQHIPYIHQLITSSFESYFEAFLDDGIDEPIHFTGSIAFYFNGLLRDVAASRGLTVGKIIKSPIAGLVLFHGI